MMSLTEYQVIQSNVHVTKLYLLIHTRIWNEREGEETCVAKC